MEIRLAEKKDIPAILALYKQLFAEAARMQPYSFRTSEQTE